MNAAMRKTGALLAKDFADLFKNPTLLVVCLLPIAFMALYTFMIGDATSDAGLTAEQQEQADKIRREGQEKIKPLMKEMKDLREKIDAERRANMEEFEKILTPEQKQKLDEMKQRGMEDFKRRIGERRGPKMRGPHHFEKLRPAPHHPEGEMLPTPPLPEEAPLD